MRTIKGWLMEGWLMKAATSAAAIALLAAVSSAGAACWFTAYQPDVPESLQ